jgi:hypothetical protein
MLYTEKREFEEASRLLKRALAVNKTFPVALVTMGNLYQKTDRAEKAIKYH